VSLLDDARAEDGRRPERQLEDLRRQLSSAKAERDEAEAAYERAARELQLMLKLDGQKSAPPAWTVKAPKAGKHHGTPWLLLSDLHLDEVVNPAEVGGVNAFNRKIAELRLRATFANAVTVTRDYWTGITYDGIVVPLAGDLYSGDIHEELSQTNEDTILGSILHWTDHLAAGLLLLAEEFGKVHVPVVVGNHSRRTRKPRAKFRARDNFDWFTGHLLARMLAGDKRITFDVSDAADAFVQSYGQRVCITHGDQATGGSGIGGIWPPLMRLDARKRARQAAIAQPYDLLIMGHWHTLTWGPSFIVNGSLKGLDEYAAINNFGFEPPQQALWLMTPEHGRTWQAPVFCQDRKAEGW
jgi:hypothetical protein